MNSKHTAGPWGRGISKDGGSTLFILAGEYKEIARVKKKSLAPDEEAEANVALMIAAPEMLEILERIIKHKADSGRAEDIKYYFVSMMYRELGNIKNIIAKAKGE